MPNLPAYMKEFHHRQQLAIEIMANNPGIRNNKVAEEVECTPETIQAYKRIPAFNEAVYMRYMDVSGGRLVSVVAAMIREAEKGNVQAATLVLKHYGKLEDKLTIRIESPFEKFLKMGDISDAVVVDEKMAEDIGGSFEVNTELPPRDPLNDRPRSRSYHEKKAINGATSRSFKAQHRKTRRNTAYLLRMRAEKVGLPPLKPGRQRKNIRDEWIRELRQREKAMGIK